MWRKGNPGTLLMKTYLSIDILENSTKILKTVKIDLPHDPVILLLSTYIQGKENLYVQKIPALLHLLQLYSK